MGKSGRGGRRRNSGGPRGLSQVARGFDTRHWSPVVVVRSRNVRRSIGLSDNEDGDGSSSPLLIQKPGGRVPSGLQAKQAAPAKIREEFRRRGAPVSGVSTVHRRGNVSMSKKVYNRLLNRRDKLEEKYVRWKSIAKRLTNGARVYKCPSKEMQIAIIALMQARGVSASSVPDILALSASYFFGAARASDLVAPSTASEYARIQGAILEARVRKVLASPENKDLIPIFVGTDTSSRGDKIASYVVSFVRPGRQKPEIHFLGFDKADGSDAQSLANAIIMFVDQLEGAKFVGLSSDAPATMVGKRNGVGQLLSEKFERFIRHDTCEHHASACVARVVENMWPAQMNVPSVTQFCYLAWYLINDDWPRVRMLIHKQLGVEEAEMDQGVIAMLERDWREEGGTIEEAAQLLLESSQLNKPNKPNSNRWRTQADMVLFVNSFAPLLAVVFDEIRCFGGAGAVPGSVEAMASQWIRWSGSPKLRVLMSMASEFLSIWRSHDDYIGLPDEDYDVVCYHKVFSRPRRALFLLTNVQGIKPVALDSFADVIEQFSGEEDEVEQMYKQFYAMALDSVVRNHGRYLSGVYAFAAFGDPDFAHIAWEAFSHFKNHSKKPAERTRLGKALEKCLREGELSKLHEVVFRRLTNKQHLDDAYLLVSMLRRRGDGPDGWQRRAFIEAVRNPGRNLVAQQLCIWTAALSSTQPVEKTFLDYDRNVSSSSGGKKGKKSTSSGKGSSLATVSAKVAVARHFGETERKIVKDVNEREKKKLKRVQAKADIVRTVQEAIESSISTSVELTAARKTARLAQKVYITPRDGVSQVEEARFQAIAEAYGTAEFRHVAKSMEALLREGQSIDVDITCKCFASEKCLRRASKKGAPGKMFSCTQCQKRFHKKCLVGEGLVPKNLAKDAIIAFNCPDCATAMAE